MQSRSYRPEIDGLRTIAVLAVIIYHAQFLLNGSTFLKGGYIGVDVFFVISGYLISRIIFKEIDKTNTFSYLNFYIRRIRRIIPVLFLVMIVSTILAWFILIPSRYIEFSKSIIYSIAFCSNIFFNHAGQNYGAEGTDLSPFLHTWSLSLEEQFYIFFPPFILFCCKKLKKKVLLAIVLVIVFSFFFSIWYTNTNPSASFYYLTSRTWELLAGTLIAYLEVKKYKKPNIKKPSLLTLTGLILLVVSFFIFDKNTAHPGFLTLIPIVGTCLIIYIADGQDIVSKLLSTKLFVSIGLISYSLYLWHQPFFAFARMTYHNLGNLEKVYLIILTFIFSLISYFAIEKTCRYKNIISHKWLFSILALLTITLLWYHNRAIRKNGFVDRLPSIVRDSFDSQAGRRTYAKNLIATLDQNYNIDDLKESTIHLVGDSHMGSLHIVFEPFFKQHNFNYHFHGQMGCVYLKDFDLIDRKTGLIKSFCNREYQQKRTSEIINSQNPIAIIGGRFPMYFNQKPYDNGEGGIETSEDWNIMKGDVSLEKGIISSIQNLLDNNVRVVLLYPIPPAGWHIPNIIYQKFKTIKGKTDINKVQDYFQKNRVTTSYENYKNFSKKVFDTFDQLNHPNLIKVYPHKLVCNTISQGRCETHNTNKVFYDDSNHPSGVYSIKILKQVLESLEE